MRTFVLRRVLQVIPILIGISVVSFAVIQLPPGDFLTVYVSNLQAQGEDVRREEFEFLVDQYALDKPLYAQYWKWASNFVQGDFGQSFYWGKPVRTLIGRTEGPAHDAARW